MDEKVLEYLLQGVNCINAGPDGRETLRMQADAEYKNGNFLNSVFYQVMMLFQTFEMRYVPSSADEETQPISVKEIRAQFNEYEKKDFQSNKLMQYAYNELLKCEKEREAVAPKKPVKEKTFEFLQDVRTPGNGLRQIIDVCQNMPQEWTIIQLTKGSRTDTTYSVYHRIRIGGAPIYLTILKHARSTKYPNPICLCFQGPNTDRIYENHVIIAKRFKECISIDPQKVQTNDEKQKYWQNLHDLDKFLESTLEELRQFFFPWTFLFTGTPVENTYSLEHMGNAFVAVDGFCNSFKWDDKERVLLSLAALHILSLNETEIEGISKALTENEKQQTAVLKLLTTMKLTAALPTVKVAIEKIKQCRYYPCILVVDECLDHFYWEEMNVLQEFCRVNSLHLLWRLHQLNKKNISKGYVVMNIQTGGCLLNPDKSLKNMEMRMKGFFKYWTPHWLLKYSEKPTSDEIFNNYFNRDCYVYSGHGTGLQYINGKNIAKQHIKGVVFLFGCDSALLRSNGLYSELIGAHYYYHAAKCPAVIGCLLPALDANMDTISTSVLSRFIAPDSKNVLKWDEVDMRAWRKEGIVKGKPKAVTLKESPDYHVGSLCELIARVHQRQYDPKFYNTVSYVCRGLPIWNSNVQRFFK